MRFGALCLVSALGCGPGAPTNPGQSTAGVGISPARDTLYASEQVQFTASVDGHPATTVWSSSNDAVLAISSTGSARGAGVGAATLTATVDAKVVRVPLRVVSRLSRRVWWSGRIDHVQTHYWRWAPE